MSTDYLSKKETLKALVVKGFSGSASWCERRDLNPYESPHTPLKRARLPIPPLSQLLEYYTTSHRKCQAFFKKKFERILLFHNCVKHTRRIAAVAEVEIETAKARSLLRVCGRNNRCEQFVKR